MFHPVFKFVLTASVALTMAPTGLGATIKLPCTADVWVSQGNQAERDTSMGRTRELKLKINQEMALMAFDVDQLKGRRVVAAELYLYPTAITGTVVAPKRGTDLRWIALSTVSSPWAEGAAERTYQQDTEGRGATFNEASYQTQPWAWPGSALPTVINGHGYSAAAAGDLAPAENGYWKVAVNPELIHVLIAGGGSGLCVMDGSTAPSVNPFVASREDAEHAPYLLVQVKGRDNAPPDPPADLVASPAPTRAFADSGAAAVTLTVPEGTVAYAVAVNGQALEPWQVARPTAAGTRQALVIEDLTPGKVAQVTIAALDAAGNRSAAAKVTVQASSAVTVPTLPATPFTPKPGDPVQVDTATSVWAFPEVDKIAPVTGRLLFAEDSLATSYPKANAVWSGADKQVRLAAARGEIVAFQLGLQTAGQPVQATITPSDLRGPAGGVISADQIKLFRVWYVKDAQAWQGEYAIPMTDGKVSLPAPDNAVTDQMFQAVYVDVIVPNGVAPGDYVGTVRVATDNGAADVGLKVVVYPVSIPDEMNFNPELNCYGGPARAGTKAFYDYHRVAHYYRCTLNRLPYSQNGMVHPDMLPVLEQGDHTTVRVSDWTPYDRAVGPLLDGSAFADNPRAGVPVKTFYTTFMENWPMSIADHYAVGAISKPDASVITGMEGEAFPGAIPAGARANSDQMRDRKGWHDVYAPAIEAGFDAAYVVGTADMVRQYVDHFQAKGWTRTQAQLYLNNKYTWGGTWWVLDEPMEWLDFNALAFLGRIYNLGFDHQTDTQFVFRGDISRPEWQGDMLDGIMQTIYFGSGSAIQYGRLLQRMIERMPTQGYLYGRCNNVGRSNLESTAWCYSAFAAGADGVLPWQSIGRAGSLVEPNTLGLLVPGDRFGLSAVASLRVAALRRGAQDCELMQLLLDKHGWTRRHADLLINQKIPLKVLFSQRFADEAAPLTYGRLVNRDFVEFKEALLQMLSR